MSTIFFSYRPKRPKQSFILTGIRDDFNDVRISSRFFQPLNEHYPNVLVNDKDNFIWLGITKSPLFLTEKATANDDTPADDLFGSARSQQQQEEQQPPPSSTKTKAGRQRPSSAISSKKKGDTSEKDQTLLQKENRDNGIGCEVKPGRIIAIIPHRDGAQLNQFLSEAQDELDAIRYKLRQEKLDAQFDLLSPRYAEQVAAQKTTAGRTYQLKNGIARVSNSNESILKDKKAIERLVTAFLTADRSITVQQYLQKIAKGSRLLASLDSTQGFNMLIGELGEGGCLYFYSNRDNDKNVYEIKQGEYCFDCTPNTIISTSDELLWRTAYGFEGFTSAVSPISVSLKEEGEEGNGDLMTDKQEVIRRLLNLLEQTQQYSDEMQDTGLDVEWEKKLSALRIQTEVYSTRQSFIMCLAKHATMSKREAKEDAERAKASITTQRYWPYSIGVICRSYYAPDTTFLVEKISNPENAVPQLDLTEATAAEQAKDVSQQDAGMIEPSKHYIILPDHSSFFNQFDEKNQGVLARFQDSFTRQTCFDIALPVRDSEKKKQEEKQQREEAASLAAAQVQQTPKSSPSTLRRKSVRGSQYYGGESGNKREQEQPPAKPLIHGDNIVLKVNIAQLVPLEKPVAQAMPAAQTKNIKKKR